MGRGGRTGRLDTQTWTWTSTWTWTWTWPGRHRVETELPALPTRSDCGPAPWFRGSASDDAACSRRASTERAGERVRVSAALPKTRSFRSPAPSTGSPDARAGRSWPHSPRRRKVRQRRLVRPGPDTGGGARTRWTRSNGVGLWSRAARATGGKHRCSRVARRIAQAWRVRPVAVAAASRAHSLPVTAGCRTPRRTLTWFSLNRAFAARIALRWRSCGRSAGQAGARRSREGSADDATVRAPAAVLVRLRSAGNLMRPSVDADRP